MPAAAVMRMHARLPNECNCAIPCDGIHGDISCNLSFLAERVRTTLHAVGQAIQKPRFMSTAYAGQLPSSDWRPRGSMTARNTKKIMKTAQLAQAPVQRTGPCTAKFPVPVKQGQCAEDKPCQSTSEPFTPSKQCLEALKRAVSLIESGERGEASRAAGRVLKPKTLKNRRSYLNRLRNNIKGDLMEALLSPSKTAKTLKERLSNPGTLEQTMRVVMTIFTEAGVDKLCSELHTRWRKALAPVTDATKAHQQQPSPGATQLFTRALSKCQELYDDPKTRYSDDHLLLSLFTKVPPRRTQDYGKVMLLGPGTAGPTPTAEQIAAAGGVWYLDGIDQGHTRLVVRTFKTGDAFKGQKQRAAHRRGESTDAVEPFDRVVDSPELLEVVRGSLERRPRRWLFTMARASKKVADMQSGAKQNGGGVPYHDADSFDARVLKRMKEMLGEDTTIDKLREGYALWVDDLRPSAAELDTICDWMGHSVETHIRMYLRRRPANSIPGLGRNHGSSSAATPDVHTSQKSS
jgi:hypothetical protein